MAAAKWTYDQVDAPDELAPLNRLLTLAFTTGQDVDTQPWVDRAGLENIRVLRGAGGDLHACLFALPFGQWFGGKRLAMAGIAAVTVGPEHRGRGAASALMLEMLREQHSRKTPISALFPATLTLYRKSGYELAGSYYGVRVPCGAVALKQREPAVRPAGEADAPAIRRCYAELGRRYNGMVDRTQYLWDMHNKPRKGAATSYLVERDGAVEGYVTLFRKPPTAEGVEIGVTDLVALTPIAGRRLLSFLGDHMSVNDHLDWRGGPTEPLLALLPENKYQVRVRVTWMLRIVHLVEALSQRGYPRAVEGELHLSVRDPLIDENNGSFVLRVADGVGSVTPGGPGAVKVDIRGLAALFTGFMSPHSLCTAAMMEAEERDMATAAAIFGGYAPFMMDAF